MAIFPGRVAVVGGGPAGLFAAERIRAAGHEVDLFDRMGSVGRKFLIAGKGGLNLTHSEPKAHFVQRYREQTARVADWLHDFDADDLRAWARGLGVETIIGSSGRVFPADFKAAPLMRSWVRRLRAQGVRFHVQHRWTAIDAERCLHFETPSGRIRFAADAVVFALGGGSWAKLGSDGQWVDALRDMGVPVRELEPSNCGFECDWSAPLRERFAGAPIKSVSASWQEIDGHWHARQGEFVLTEQGVEGSLIYALSAPLREQIHRHGVAELRLDLFPNQTEQQLRQRLTAARKGETRSRQLARCLGLKDARLALLRDCVDNATLKDDDALCQAAKSLTLHLLRTRPIDEAISTAGGVRLETLDSQLMSCDLPGVFFAGEMLDWEAPTGGYLLTACYASGARAANGVDAWLQGIALRKDQ